MPCVSSRELLLPHETRDKKHSMMNADADIRRIPKREMGKKMFFIQEYTNYDLRITIFLNLRAKVVVLGGICKVHFGSF